MIEKTLLAPAITRNRQLSLEEIKSLNLPMTFQGDQVVIYTSLTGWKLKKPVTIELKNILDAKEKGLVDYIIRSCLNDRPGVIAFIFDNQSMLKLARHFLRHLSGSYRSCLTYSVNVKKYATWLGYTPRLNYPRRQTCRRNPRPHKSTEPLWIPKRLPRRTTRRRPQTSSSKQLHQSCQNLLPRKRNRRQTHRTPIPKSRLQRPSPKTRRNHNHAR